MAQDDFGDWDPTDSNNTSVTGSGAAINIAEGMTPGLVNNGMRAIMAAAAISWGRMPSGTSRPASVQANGFWLNTTAAASPVITWYDGTDDIAFATVDTTNNTIDLSAAVDATNAVGAGGISNVVEDTTPQLGGDLDVNGQQITSASNGNVVIDPNGTGVIHLGSSFYFEDDTDSGVSYVGDANYTLDIAGSAVMDLAAAAATFQKQAKSAIKTLTSATGITVTMTDESVQFVELDHNATFTISGDAAGQWVTLIIKQGTTGGTGTFSGVDIWQGGGSAPTLSTTTGEYDIINMFVIAGPVVIASHVGP